MLLAFCPHILRSGRDLWWTFCSKMNRGCLPRGQGVSSWGCLPREVSVQGVCLPRGCLPRGCVCPGKCVSQHALGRILDTHGQNCWHTLVKTLPFLNYVANSNNSRAWLHDIFTACKRSLGQGNVFTCDRHSVHGEEVCVWCDFVSGCWVPCSFQRDPSVGSLSRGVPDTEPPPSWTETL